MNVLSTFVQLDRDQQTKPRKRFRSRLVELGLLVAVAALLVYAGVYALGAYQDVQTSLAQIGTALELG